MAHKIALVGVHSPQYAELASITWDQNKKLYCQRHEFYGEDKLVEMTPSIPFDKMRLIHYYLKQHRVEWVWATGTDSLITNFTNDLSGIIDNPVYANASFLVASDRNGINADSFLIKNSDDGLYFLDFILEGEGKESEQHWINVLFADEENKDKMYIVPQRDLNSYNYDLYPNPQDRFDKLGTDGHWQHGDLLIHWPGFSDDPGRRVVWAREYLNKVVMS